MNVSRRNVTCTNAIRRLLCRAAALNIHTTAELADTFSISRKTVNRILSRFNATDETDKKQQGGYKHFM